MRRCIPTFIKFVHKFAVLERFSFSRFPMLTRVKRETSKTSSNGLIFFYYFIFIIPTMEAKIMNLVWMNNKTKKF